MCYSYDTFLKPGCYFQHIGFKSVMVICHAITETTDMRRFPYSEASHPTDSKDFEAVRRICFKWTAVPLFGPGPHTHTVAKV